MFTKLFKLRTILAEFSCESFKLYDAPLFNGKSFSIYFVPIIYLNKKNEEFFNSWYAVSPLENTEFYRTKFYFSIIIWMKLYLGFARFSITK